MQFQILKCSESSSLRYNSDPACAQPSEIDTFVSDLEVETKTISNEVDFTIYKQEPSFVISDTLGYSLLNS